MPQGVAGGKIERSRTCTLSWKCSCFIFSTYCCLHKHYGGKTSPLFFFFPHALPRFTKHCSAQKSPKQFQHCCFTCHASFYWGTPTSSNKITHGSKVMTRPVLLRAWIVIYRTNGSLTTSTIFINRLYSCSFTEELDHAAHAYLGSVSRYFWL